MKPLLSNVCGTQSQESGKEPTESLVTSKGKFSAKPYRNRWGSIKKAFSIARQRFPMEIPAGVDVKPLRVESAPANYLETGKIKIIPKTMNPKEKKRDTVYGQPINFRGLRHAPVNEQAWFICSAW
ncbi:MAG: hypothetical protein HZA02_05500 [Nitrospinae bacterium]|nr:hypothetical protein [Nitrospinota bacterium]